MTINEARQLREDEDNFILRQPENMLTTNAEEQKLIGRIVWLFAFLTYSRNGHLTFIQRLSNMGYAKNIKKNNKFIVSVSGKGTIKKPYKLKTPFGEGNIYNARYFVNPRFLRKNYKESRKKQMGNCYKNASMLNLARAESGKESQQLSGIAFVDYAFCHSVCAFVSKWGEKLVIDPNYDIVMSYDLYMKLFSFEVLCSIDGKKFMQDRQRLMELTKHYSYEEFIHAFAYQEDIVRLQKEAKEKSTQILKQNDGKSEKEVV